MKSFKYFLESEVPVRLTNYITGKLKDYAPGTFGIEIEFRTEDSESDIDYDSAREAWQDQADIPIRPNDWTYENPKPDKPDKDDYKITSDFMTNYWNLNMERKAVDGNLPEIITTEKCWKLFNDTEKVYLCRNIVKVQTRITLLFQGKGDLEQNFNFFKSTEKFNIFIRQLEMTANATISPKVLSTSNHLTKEQSEYLDSLLDAVFKTIDEFRNFHLKRAKAITPREYNIKIKEIWENDYEEWEQELKDWEREYLDVIEAWNDWDEEGDFDNWLYFNMDDYTTKSGLDYEIEEMKKWFERNGQKVRIPSNKKTDVSAWNVFEDEENVVEIASPILTIKDFPFVEKLLKYLSNKNFDTNTGLHVHLGTPPLTDAFDLLSVANIIDEEHIVGISGREEDSLTSYAQRKDELFKALAIGVEVEKYNPRTRDWDVNFVQGISGTMSNNQLYDWLSKNVGKYYGVNLAQAFKEHKTIEMRYLTSQIVNDPKKLFEVINYFLMLPRLAQSKSQIRHDSSWGTVIISRRPGNSVEINVFLKNDLQKQFPHGIIKQLPTKPKAPKSNLPVSDLRVEKPDDLKYNK